MAPNPAEPNSAKTGNPEKILEFLHRNRKDEYVSGEDIARHLKISRQQVWQEISALRSSGCEILAVPHLGYRLEALPDRLLPFLIEEGLKTRFIGRRIFYRERCSSTMDAAQELASQDSPEGTLVVAEVQTKGRGRLARHWVSPKHKGLYFTLILKPKILPAMAPMLTLLSAVAVCEAIKASTGITASIKWPNDILVDHKKLGGILTEVVAEPERVHFVFTGIGINVNNEHQELLKGAVSLRACSHSRKKFDRVEILRCFLTKFEDNYADFQKHGSRQIVDKWKKLNTTLGRKVRVATGRDDVEGMAVDIAEDGALLVRRDSGRTEKFMSGDVVHLR